MSTFVGSPLKIELIGTGEQVGTWGDTTNNNFKALQEAITGSATLDFSGGNVTLTLSDSNALTNARNLRLVCTGATINSDLVLASGLDIEKLYLVQNDTSYTITVKRSGGDAGVAIPAGGKRFVFNDGTNVVEAININVSSGVSGTLPIANGGTNTTTTPTDGGVAYGTGTAYAFSTAGTSGYALISQGAGSAPTWQQVTNSNTASTIVARDASGDFSAGTITASLSGNASTSSSCSGNAATATKLANTRTINGTNFDGSANITVPVNTSQKSDNVAYQIPFVTSVTAGNQSLFTDSTAAFTYNPSTNTLTVGTLSGSFSGNASTATTLQTARTINGTSFNGSANITTTNWGSSRTITIGNTGKSVNGSADVSWTLSEIGVSTDLGAVGTYALLAYVITGTATTTNYLSYLASGTTVAGSSLRRSSVTTINNNATEYPLTATYQDAASDVLAALPSTGTGASAVNPDTTNTTTMSGTWRLVGGNCWFRNVNTGAGAVGRWPVLLWVRIS